MLVILGWSQAGGQPRIADHTVYNDVDDALAGLEEWRSDAPRGERYTVHQLNDEINEED